MICTQCQTRVDPEDVVDGLCDGCVDALLAPRSASTDLDSLGRFKATGAERVTRRSAPSGVLGSKTRAVRE